MDNEIQASGVTVQGTISSSGAWTIGAPSTIFEVGTPEDHFWIERVKATGIRKSWIYRKMAEICGNRSSRLVRKAPHGWYTKEIKSMSIVNSRGVIKHTDMEDILA